jgi:multisubunit Na+/H+ antiporter MnhB subunit
MLILYVLMLFMIIAAVIAVETRSLLSAVICVGSIGFVGSIILIRATISRDLTFISGDKEFFGVVVSIVLIAVIFLAGMKVLDTLPAFGTAIFTQVPDAASQVYLSEGLQRTGAANIVTSVILDFRAYDTLGEATVLFTSILGASVILRKKSKRRLGGSTE